MPFVKASCALHDGNNERSSDEVDVQFITKTILAITMVVALASSAHAASLNPQFSIHPKTAFTNEPVIFSALLDLFSADPITSYAWNFGDGTTGSGILTLHSYKTAGNFQVTLSIRDRRGKTATASKTISIQQPTPPNPVITITPLQSSDGLLKFRFSAKSSTDPNSRIIAYIWNFGDGTGALGPETEHSYKKLGHYTVSLRITDLRGLTAQTHTELDVTGTPPTVKIAANPISGSVPLKVKFSSVGTKAINGKIKTFTWTFGDGATAADPSPTHTFTQKGLYHTTLVVTDTYGQTGTASQDIGAGISNQPPTAKFIFAANTGLGILNLNVDATSSTSSNGAITSYRFDFGDGSTATTAQAQHTYQSPGTYSVSLTVVDSVGLTGTTSQTVAIVDSTAPTVTLSAPLANAVNTVPNLAIAGTSDERISALTATWENNSPVSMTIAADQLSFSGNLPVHVNGAHILTIKATDLAGNIGTQTFQFSESLPLPTAVISMFPQSAIANQSLSFSGFESTSISGLIVDYQWDFGDSTTADGPGVPHTYSQAGSYVVKLAVADQYGLVGTATQTVSVSQVLPPIVSFTAATKFNGVYSVSVDASGSAAPSGFIVSNLIDFGDGASTPNLTGTHNYASGGSYTIQVTVMDNLGQTTTKTQVVTLADTTAPTISISSPKDGSVIQAGPIQISGISSEALGTAMFSIDGSAAVPMSIDADGVDINGQIALPAAGQHTLTVTVQDLAQNQSSAAVHFFSGTAPISSFVANPRSGQAPTTINFSAAKSLAPNGSIASYAWSFGDLTTASGSSVSHAYNSPGAYTVFLTVTDSVGAQSTSSQQIVISQYAPPVADFSITNEAGTGTMKIHADASSSSAGSAISEYAFDFGDGSSATGEEVDHIYHSPGTYVVTLKVTDQSGAVGYTTQTYTIKDNVAPAVAVDAPTTGSPVHSLTVPVSGQTNEVITSATAYLDSSSVLTIGPDQMSFSGNVLATTGGNRTVKVTVGDAAGNFSTIEMPVTIAAPPVPVITSPSAFSVPGSAMQFSALSSFGTSGDIVSYVWDFGDTAQVAPQALRASRATIRAFDQSQGSGATGAIVTHTYSSPGSYTVTLTITDSMGSVNTITQIVNIEARTVPVASFFYTTDTHTGQLTLSVNATPSTSALSTIVDYSWDFADGTTAHGVQINHQFTNPGTYPVGLTVTDADGLVGFSAQTVTIQDLVPPIITILSPANLNDAQTPTFSVSGTSSEPLQAAFVSVNSQYRSDLQVSPDGLSFTGTFTWPVASGLSLPVVEVVGTDRNGNQGLTFVQASGEISSGIDFTCSIFQGALYCWGSNDFGNLGLGSDSPDYFLTPQQVGTLKTWTAVSTDGKDYACGIAAGSLYCWGDGFLGLNGNNDPQAFMSPQKVGTDTTWESVSVSESGTACGTNDGKLYCWGKDLFGQAGQGTLHTDPNAPPAYPNPVQVGNLSGWTSIGLGYDAVCGIEEGQLYCWGIDTNGQLGLSATPNGTIYMSPQQVGTLSHWTTVSVGENLLSCGIEEGNLFCWGFFVNSYIPTQVSALQNWSQVSIGTTYGCAINQGELFCAGYNAYGQIGNNAIDPTGTIPFQLQQIGTDSDWNEVHAYYGTTCAKKADESTYCWGKNDLGQLGLGNTTTYLTPQPVDPLISMNRSPTLTIGFPLGGTYSTPMVPVGGTSDIPLTGITISVDGSSAESAPVTPDGYSFSGTMGPLANGDHSVTIVATGPHGNTTTVTKPFTVLVTGLPNTTFTYAPVTPTIAQDIIFNGLGTHSALGVPVGFFWDFGDQTSASGPIADHFYAAPGMYTVRLTVFDSTGAAGYQTQNILVTDQLIAPTVSISYSGPQTVTTTSTSAVVTVNSPYPTITTVIVNGSLVLTTPGQYFTLPISLTQEGPNTISIATTDKFGQQASALDLNIIRNTTPSTITFSIPAASSKVAPGPIPVQIKSSRPIQAATVNGSAMAVSADGLSAQGTLNASSAGSLTLLVLGTDSSGNSVTAQEVISVAPEAFTPWSYSECPAQ